MKKAISLGGWVDLTDGHEYRAGDAFPHDGRAIPDERLNELASSENQTGIPVIFVEEVEEPKKKTK